MVSVTCFVSCQAWVLFSKAHIGFKHVAHFSDGRSGDFEKRPKRTKARHLELGFEPGWASLGAQDLFFDIRFTLVGVKGFLLGCSSK